MLVTSSRQARWPSGSRSVPPDGIRSRGRSSTPARTASSGSPVARARGSARRDAGSSSMSISWKASGCSAWADLTSPVITEEASRRTGSRSATDCAPRVSTARRAEENPGSASQLCSRSVVSPASASTSAGSVSSLPSPPRAVTRTAGAGRATPSSPGKSCAAPSPGVDSAAHASGASPSGVSGTGAQCRANPAPSSSRSPGAASCARGRIVSEATVATVRPSGSAQCTVTSSPSVLMRTRRSRVVEGARVTSRQAKGTTSSPPLWRTAACRAASSSAGCAVAPEPSAVPSGRVTSAKMSVPRTHIPRSPAKAGP
ncbi:hypothetical protein V6574_00915 [Streptomyces sp. SM1P]